MPPTHRWPQTARTTLPVEGPGPAAGRAARARGSGDGASNRQEHEKRGEHQGESTCHSKLPRPLRPDLLVEAKACCWRNEAEERLQYLAPTDQRQDSGRTRPDVVEGDNHSTETQTEKAFNKHSGPAEVAELGEELHPGCRLKNVREPDYQEAHRREDLNGSLHTGSSSGYGLQQPANWPRAQVAAASLRPSFSDREEQG